MEENKKILLSVTILDNFVEAKKKVDEAKKSLNDFIKSGEKNATMQRDLAQNLAKTTNEFKTAKINLESYAKTEDMLAVTTDKVGKTMGEMQRELKALRNTPLDFGDPEKVRQVEQAMADLTAEIDDYKVKIKGLDTGEIFKNASSAVEAGSALIQVTSQISKIAGVESETFGRLIDSTTELIAVTQALGVITEFLDQKRLSLLKANIAAVYSENNLKVAKLLGINVTAAQTAAEEAAIVIKGKSSIASKAAAVAQWLWNSAILANPLVAIIAVIVAAVAAVYLLTRSFDSSTASQETARKTNIAYDQQVQKTQNTIDAIEAKRTKQMFESELAGRKELDNLKRGGATKEQLAAKEVEIANRTRNIQIKASADIVKAKLDEIRMSDKNIKAQFAVLENLDKGTEAYSKQVNVINELTKKKKEAAGVLTENVNTGKDLTQQNEEAKTNLIAENSQKRKDISQRNAKATLDIDNISKNTLIKSYDEILSKAQSSYNEKLTALENSETQQIAILQQTSNFDKKQKGITDKEKLLIDQKFEADKLNIQKNTEKEKKNLERQELDRQLTLMDDVVKAFVNENQIKIAAGKSTDEEMLSYKAELAQREYDNETKALKLKLENGLITKQEYDRLLIKSEQDKNLKIAENNKAVVDLEKNRKLTNLNNELELAKGNINLEHALKLKALKDQQAAEIEAAKQSGASVALINEKYARAEQDLALETTKKKFEAIKQYADAAMVVLNGANELAKAIEAGQLADAEEKNSGKVKLLDDQLKNGLISQKEHDKQVAASAVELDKKKKKIAYDQAVREKELNIFKTIINTAAAVVAALPNVALSILAGVTGAIELGTILATPLPKASRGMLLNGASHASGGIHIEAEGGEAIINKRSTAMFAPILSMLNVAGGGVAFAPSPVFSNDGGYSARSAVNNSSMSEDQMQRAMEKAFEKIKIYATVEDIKKADKNYTSIEDRANY